MDCCKQAIAGDLLHRVETDNGIEWWLLDEHGNLIEGFWLKQ